MELLTDKQISDLNKELSHLAFTQSNSARMWEIGRILRDDENMKNNIRLEQERKKEEEYKKRFAYLFPKPEKK